MEITGTIAKILVPTDFSTGSAKAWKTAQQVAASVGAELVLLHVLPATPLDIEALDREEERFADLRSRQAANQIGIPRTDAPPHPAHVFHGPLFGESVKEFSAAGREWATLLEEWADAARRAGLKVTTVLRVGVPYREVIAAAAVERVDLVLLATHGRGEIHRLLVGSVADKVIRMAPCPVMTIREAA
ncbi:MAG: universal stress protein [Candidatus Rokubacteria bacterium]|nr:universal stress protein [Candidatus Rokubacteria bacterium]